jgi:membrane protease subunit HflK
VYSNVTKVMVDTRSGSNLLYLPLDKILQQQGVSPATAPATASANDAPATTGTIPPADVRSRDGSRTRDREGR